MKNRILVLTGPTSVGKTSISIELAKKLNAEIISADSMQIYRKMDIGTAKITDHETKGIPHHMIDIIDPSESYSAADFKEQAQDIIKRILSEGKNVIIAGGTGLYINSLLYDMDFNRSSPDLKIREDLINLYNNYGTEYLYNMLREKDAETAALIHPNNVKRVMRALEILTNNSSFDKFNNIKNYNEEYIFKIYILNIERNILYDRINSRVDKMIADGLIKEVMELKKLGYDETFQSMKAIGYRQVLQYLDGEISLDECIDLIKRDSRRYAKRQLTWFKKYENSIWFDVEKIQNNDIIDNIIRDFFN